MNYKTLLSFFTLLTLFFSACNLNPNNQPKSPSLSIDEQNRLFKTAQSIFAPLPKFAATENNTFSEAKLKLGKLLYFDNRLSKNKNISCNSCHRLDLFGVDQLPVSPGDDGITGDRNSPTTLNAALHFAQFWDGRAKHVEEQAGMPILNPIEMNIPSENFLLERLSATSLYPSLFQQAFPESEPAITYQNIQNAIGLFERNLLTPSPFDDYLNGNKNALNMDEKIGLQTFIEVGCASCHAGVAIGGNSFQKFGLFREYTHYTGSKHFDLGRFSVTNDPADKAVFKVPSLRNIAATYPYFHDGSVLKLEDAISIMAQSQLNKNLTATQVLSIQTFLNSLTGNLPEELKSFPESLNAL